MHQEIRFCTSLDNTRLAYAKAGHGPALVKVANWLGHLEYEWNSLVWRPWLDAWMRGRTLYRYDQRGCGLSDWNVSDFSFEALVSDLETIVDKANLSIHSRNAPNRVLDQIERHCRKSTPVLHWFSGTLQQTRRARELGCWFSVGPIMLRGAKGRTILQELPVDRILPETDGPFATNGSVPLMPWEAINITDAIAPLWGTAKDEVILQLKRNLSALVNL